MMLNVWWIYKSEGMVIEKVSEDNYMKLFMNDWNNREKQV